MDKRLYIRVATQLLLSPLAAAVLLFLPAGTLNYWQAWVFAAVFFGCNLALSTYLLFKDPALLERACAPDPSRSGSRSRRSS
jgi:hypothetical protein